MTENNKVNDTIVDMVKKLKSCTNIDLNNHHHNHFEFGASSSNNNNQQPPTPNPGKRSLANNWNDTSQSSGAGDLTPLPKKFKSLDFNHVGSPREVRCLRADLLEARNTIMNLEKRIQHMHGVRRETQIMFDNETRALQRQREYDVKSIEELDAQLQSIRQRERGLKVELAEVRNKYNQLKVYSDERIEVLEKSVCEYKEQSRVAESAVHSETVALKRKIDELQVILVAAEEDAEAQKKLAIELQKQLSEKNAIERDVELKDQALHNAKLRIKELEYMNENYVEFQEQSNAQSFKIANYSVLEKENQRLINENSRLKDEIKNKLVLEEEVNDLKSRLINYKENEKKWSNLQVQHVQIEMDLDEWRAVARGICETTGNDSMLPHLLRNVVERLQQQEITLTSAKVELESQLNVSIHDSKTAKSELERNQKLLNDMRKTDEQKQNLIHRMQKKLLLVSRERDSYRLQLDSYEKDLTMSNVSTTQSTTTSTTHTNQLQSQRERIDKLENIVESYREMVAKLEHDLQIAQPNVHKNDIGVPIRAEQLARYHEQIEQLKMENERLTERKDQLEIQLENYLVGNDTAHGGNIYHYADNPLSQCLSEREKLIEKLRDESDKLKRKIKNMEEGLESSKLNESASLISAKDLQLLKDQLKKYESQKQHLQDCFKSSMNEFRNVIYLLLGYKVDRTANAIYKLTSMYAERAEHQLCFQLSEGALNLLENEFSATLDDMVNLHLRHQKSVPVFLSSITLDLFNNQTLATKSFDIE